MSKHLKDFFSPDLVRDIGASIARVHEGFPVQDFVRDATRGLNSLELLDRGRHIATALGQHLPQAYAEAIDILVASLGPVHARDELVGAGMAPFFYLPHVMFVAEHGLDDFERSMAAQRELTRRFTAEFSIRAFLAKDPNRTLAVLEEWAADPDPHVRRLVSEGTRPRLPWASRVRFLDENPERALGLLEKLKDDPATMVQRSVANHLNDLGKARPDLLVETCGRWLKEAPAKRRRLVEHALRSAVKRGLPGALALLGHGDAAEVTVEEVRFVPERVAIGDKVQIWFTLHSRANKTQALLVDLAVHFVKAQGLTRAKVFKVTRIELLPGSRASLTRSISLAVHTTRKPYPGTHPVDVLVNGTRFAAGAFEVVASKRAR